MNQPLLFRTVAGRQSNHEGFYMPPGIRHLGTLSLYRAVAWWGLFLGREFTRDDVSERSALSPAVPAVSSITSVTVTMTTTFALIPACTPCGEAAPSSWCVSGQWNPARTPSAGSGQTGRAGR